MYVHYSDYGIIARSSLLFPFFTDSSIFFGLYALSPAT